jgi:diaminobutyrate-2-oxoglutarate transaminase
VPMAKSLSGMGLPFAALLLKPELDIWKPAEHNGTFRGNQHAFVTARVALEKFWSDDVFQGEIAEKARLLSERLDGMSSALPGSRLKGRGMMQGIDVGSGELAASICAECFRRGLVIETSGAQDEVVKVLAPLTTPGETLERGLDILASSIAQCAQQQPMAAE